MPLNQLEIRTEEINEILGKAPNKIIRIGISVILIIFLILLIGSWFFKYPDFITSTIEITSEIPPAEIVAKASGKIEYLFVSDKELVQKGDYLVILENPAEYVHVMKMLHFSDSLKEESAKINHNLIGEYLSSKKLVLGEIQPSLSSFISSNNQLINFYQIQYHGKKINGLNKQVNGQREYRKMLKIQMQTLGNDLSLMEKEYERYKILFKNQTIAESELEKIERSYLQKKYAVEGASTNLVIIDNQITNLSTNIIDLELQKQQQEILLINQFQESFDNFYNQLKTWELRYVLKSPIKGRCTFNAFWNANQNVTAGEKVLTVIPTSRQNIIGKLSLPVRGSGKVKVGQKVNIKLLNYPYMEYGMLQGAIRSISMVPSENFYSVEIYFQNGMLTNYGKTLDFYQRMQGSAEIITDDIRLIERIFMPIKSLIKNRSFKK